MRYTWKDAALTQTTPPYALTKWTFTGQFSYADDPSTPGVEDFGLLYFNARWVDPYLNQFTQPDTMVPNQHNPQDWNRYSYARYNPLKYADPTGHSVDCGIGMGCVTPYTSPSNRDGRESGDGGEIIKNNPPSSPDPKLIIPPLDGGVCPEEYSLVQCAYSGDYYQPYGDINMDNDEFNQLLIAIFFDLKNREPVGGYDFANRQSYDTPLWDDYGSFTGQVCFGNQCYGRSEVNYVAQGMWVAAAEQSNAEGRLGVTAWKLYSFVKKPLTYFPPVPSEGTLIWFDRGYETYNVLNNSYPYP